MRTHSFSLGTVLMILLTGLMLVSCGEPPAPTPTPLPTATATPRSTPLPEVPTAIPLASEDRPLTILMLPQGTRRQAASAVEDLDALIRDLSGLNVEVQLVNSYGEIVSQLCSANPVVGWLDGIAYTVAETQGCADPALWVKRGGNAGFRVDLLMDAAHTGDRPDPTDVSRLSDGVLCRVSDEDQVNWQVAELMLRAGGINPLTDLSSILEVADYDALVQAIYDGECDGGVVPKGYLADGIGADLKAVEDLREKVVVVTTSPEIPYNVMVYPQIVPLNVRIPLTDVFVQISADRQNARVLANILRQDTVQRVSRSDFEDFSAFMESTGLDFAALGE